VPVYILLEVVTCDIGRQKNGELRRVEAIITRIFDTFHDYEKGRWPEKGERRLLGRFGQNNAAA
jgi:hypothetical protein